MKRFIGLSLVAAAATLLAFSIAAAANGDNGGGRPDGENRRPPWVNVDGSVDVQKMPDTLPVFDRHGEVCGWVSKSELLRDPTPQEEAAAREKAARTPGTTTTYANGGIHGGVAAEPTTRCQ